MSFKYSKAVPALWRKLAFQQGKRCYSVKSLAEENRLAVGDRLHGYVVNQIVPVPELYLTATSLTHEKTGAEHLHITRNDDNNVFGVGFRTTPMDSTGVAHILEHTALCGSAKFPVRDPFFKMLTRSLATFMNAFTASDWTMYPFSTQNDQDFKNLLSVYLDAAFFPRLSERDFSQEGWRLENEDPNDPSSPIIYKGVVFNEMKGVFSDSQQWFSQKNQNYLLPGHTYSIVSGGDPENITDLTWEQLKEFHRSHYHPSNARFYTYGNIPVENHLDCINSHALQHFEKIETNTAVPRETRWDAPRSHKITCSPDPMAPDQNKQTIISASYLLSDVTEPYESFVMSLICSLLVNGETAPFYKSLLEANIGSDYAPTTGYCGYTRDASFSVGLQGVAESDVDKISEIIEGTFESVIKNGFEPERIEAILHSIELGLKHQTTKFGLNLGISLLPSWIHGGEAPEFIQVNKSVDKFKKSIEENPRYLQDKVDQYFGKGSKHKMTLVMSPDENFNKIREEKEKDKLKGVVEQLTDSQKNEILVKGKELIEEQMREEDLSCLPTLKVEDIPKDLPGVQTDIVYHGNVPIQLSTQPTNEISYVKVLSDISDLPRSLLPFVPLFCTVVTKMGAGLYDFKELSQKIELKTGGISASTHITENPSDINLVEQGVLFSSHCLNRNITPMFDLLQEIFLRLNLKDNNRLKTLIMMCAAELSSSLVQAGHSYAMAHSASSLTPAQGVKEMMGGMTQVNLMKGIAEQNDPSDVVEFLKEIASHLLNRNNIRCSINSNPDGMDNAVFAMENFISNLPCSSDEKIGNDFYRTSHTFEPSWSQTHFELPFQVNYMSRSIRTTHYTDPDFANLRLIARLMTTKFLHREIREKGGAYGGGAGGGNPGVFSFYSYRDPNSMKTLDLFEDSIDWATQGNINQQDIDEAKLSVFQQLDAPTPPGSKGSRNFMYHISDDMRQTHRQQIFSASKDSIIGAATKYLGKEVRLSSASFLGPQNEATEKSELWTVKKP